MTLTSFEHQLESERGWLAENPRQHWNSKLYRQKVVVLNLNDVRLTKLIVSVLNRVCLSLWCYKTGMWALTAAARRWTRERRRRTRQRLTDDEGGGGRADVTPLSGYRAISLKPKQICLITLSSHWQRRALSKNFFPYKFIFLWSSVVCIPRIQNKTTLQRYLLLHCPWLFCECVKRKYMLMTQFVDDHDLWWFRSWQ